MEAADLAFAGIARQAELVREKAVSSQELVQLHLERIERFDPRLNAFCRGKLFVERALAEAAEADKRLAAGEQAPLLGVPVAIKDTTDVAGVVTSFGTAGFDQPAAADAEVVRSLREAGAIVIGKTNLPELAIFGFTESEAWGVTRNPWNTVRTTGGSSGGSGAAVAAGLVGIASASDGGGSIRIPAANCGLFGLRPQNGRVPIDPADHWRGLSVNGCVSRTVLDTALYLDLTIARSGPGVPPPPERPYVDSARTPPGKLCVAVSAKPMRVIAPPIVSDEVKGALAATEDLLRSLGHEVRREDPKYGGAANNFIARYLTGIHDDVAVVPHPERLEPRTRAFGRLGGLFPAALFRRAVTAAASDAARINAIFERCDVLMTPTVGEPPVEADRWRGKGMTRTLVGMSRTYCFTPIWNHTGQPAAAVPAGFTADGSPLSVQLIAPPGREDVLISLAAQIEAERPWADRRPPIG